MDKHANNILQKSLRNMDVSYKSREASQRAKKPKARGSKKGTKIRRKSKRKEKLSSKLGSSFASRFKGSPIYHNRKKSSARVLKRDRSASSKSSKYRAGGATDLRGVRKREASRSRNRSNSRRYGVGVRTGHDSKPGMGKVKDLKSKIEQYEEETIPNMTNLISELRLQLEAKEIRIHELELDLQDKEDEIIEIQSHSSLQVEQNSSQMRDELNRAYQQINDMSLKIQKTKEYYQIELSKSQDEVKDLKDQLKIVQDNAEEDFDEMRDEIKKLKKKLKKKKEKEREKEREGEISARAANDDLSSANEEIKSLRLRLKEVISENDNHLQMANNEIEQLKEDLSEKEDELAAEKKRYNTVHLALRKKLEQNAMVFNKQLEERANEIEQLNRKISLLEDYPGGDDNASNHNRSSYSGDLKSVNYVNNTLQIPENYLKEIESNIQQREFLLNSKVPNSADYQAEHDQQVEEEKGLANLLARLEDKMKNLENITQSTTTTGDR